MPDSNSKKTCTDLFNQWAVSTACLQNDIRQSQEFIELQRLFWECAYEACFEEQGGRKQEWWDWNISELQCDSIRSEHRMPDLYRNINIL